MKKILILGVSLFLFSFLNAQNNENKDVTIITTGSGLTLEEAQKAALRSAIEQSFGAFISSKTEIFNDQLVADEIVSVSSGNIKSFEIISQNLLPDGRLALTVRSIVSIGKLSSFAQSKGVDIEVKGGLFALNIKQQILNEQSEIKAIAEMIGLLHEPLQVSFDYAIQSGQPESKDAENNKWSIPLKVTVTCNKNIDICSDYFRKTLNALSLNPTDVENYQLLKKPIFPINLLLLGEDETFYLRKAESMNMLKSLLYSWNFYIKLFNVDNGIKSYSFHRSRGTKGIIELGESKLYADKMNINFPSAGNVVGTITWNDELTLSQIEQISGYSVKPYGVVSQYKHGGYLIYEQDGHGLVISVVDIGGAQWNEGNEFWQQGKNLYLNEAITQCENLNINGYSDWILPSIEILEFIHQYQDFKGILKFYYHDHNDYGGSYLSSTSKQDSRENSPYCEELDILSGRRYSSTIERCNGFVRPVRYFGKWPENTVENSEKEDMRSRREDEIVIKQFDYLNLNFQILKSDNSQICIISPDIFENLFSSGIISNNNLINGDILKYNKRKYASNRFIIKTLTVNNIIFSEVEFLVDLNLKDTLILNKNISKKISSK
jgi:hypothetical protein